MSESPETWAKLCLEAQDGGGLSVVSVVTKTLSDDATSTPVEANTAYLQVKKSDNVFFFYASEDGRNWKIVRKVNISTSDALSIGFSAQSPEGAGAEATFSDIHYKPGSVDLWNLN